MFEMCIQFHSYIIYVCACVSELYIQWQCMDCFVVFMVSQWASAWVWDIHRCTCACICLLCVQGYACLNMYVRRACLADPWVFVCTYLYNMCVHNIPDSMWCSEVCVCVRETVCVCVCTCEYTCVCVCVRGWGGGCLCSAFLSKDVLLS